MQVAEQSVPTLRGMLTVQNCEPNATVFSKTINGDLFKVQFAAAGYEGDTERVPARLAEDIDFVKSLERGVFKVIDGPEDIVKALQFETQKGLAQREEQAAKAVEMIDRAQERDILGATCIGPAPANRSGECGRSIIQSAKQTKEVPPLCSQHVHLTDTFYLAEAGSKGDGATPERDGVVRREWRKVTLTERRSL